MQHSKQSKIEKIRALADRGIDGEKQNAIEMLKKLVGSDTVELYTREQVQGGGWEEETIAYRKKRRINDIPVPYLQFAKTNAVKRAITKLMHDIVTEVTGTIAVYNWADKITCVCDAWDISRIEEIVAAQVYEMLCKMGVPVIHKGGDVAGFGPSDDSMEDGTLNSIFQFQSCNQYTAPNMIWEMKSAMELQDYNCFVVWVGDAEYWGRVTSFDDSTGAFTLTPLNPKYGPKTLVFKDVDMIFKVTCKGGDMFNVIPGKENEMGAAILRRQIIVNKHLPAA